MGRAEDSEKSSTMSNSLQSQSSMRLSSPMLRPVLKLVAPGVRRPHCFHRARYDGVFSLNESTVDVSTSRASEP